jgi:hypothetical protein
LFKSLQKLRARRAINNAMVANNVKFSFQEPEVPILKVEYIQNNNDIGR